MNIAVCYNIAPETPPYGESCDKIADADTESVAHAVGKALTSRGYRVQMIGLNVDPLFFAATLRCEPPDAVFNLCEGVWGDPRREPHVAALFELTETAYTGATPLCLGLTQDKLVAKDLLRAHGLPTPPYCCARRGERFPKVRDLSWPLIVKPRFEDASQGIGHDSIVNTPGALRERIDYVHTCYRQDALIEEYIDGREINVAILGNDPTEILPAAEIVFHPSLPSNIVSFAGKWLETSREFQATRPVCPAALKTRDAMIVRDTALRAYRLLGCRDYARVDMRLRNGIPYILEINANPDISPGAGFSRAAAAAGYKYPTLIERILHMALRRRETRHASA